MGSRPPGASKLSEPGSLTDCERLFRLAAVTHQGLELRLSLVPREEFKSRVRDGTMAEAQRLSDASVLDALTGQAADYCFVFEGQVPAIIPHSRDELPTAMRPRKKAPQRVAAALRAFRNACAIAGAFVPLAASQTVTGIKPDTPHAIGKWLTLLWHRTSKTKALCEWRRDHFAMWGKPLDWNSDPLPRQDEFVESVKSSFGAGPRTVAEMRQHYNEWWTGGPRGGRDAGPDHELVAYAEWLETAMSREPDAWIWRDPFAACAELFGRIDAPSPAVTAAAELPPAPAEALPASGQLCGSTETAVPAIAAVPTLPPVVERAPAAPFQGGPMVVFQDRVELCGVVICGQHSTVKMRNLLDLLQRKRNGSFVAYSGEELAGLLGSGGGQNSVAGLVRDLRGQICEALGEQANIQCGPDDVILSRGPGYRLKEWITVENGDAGQDQGHGGSSASSDDPNRDPNHDPNRDTDHDPDRDPDDPNGAPARRKWILAQLANGRPLRAPDVVDQFRCSLATAKRDLQALKDAKKIEFDGAPRTGFYRLKKPRAQADA